MKDLEKAARIKNDFYDIIEDTFSFDDKSEYDYLEANRVSRGMISAFPDNLDGHMLLGYSRFRLNFREKAFKSYDKVLSMISDGKKHESIKDFLGITYDFDYKYIIKIQKEIDKLEAELRNNPNKVDNLRELGLDYYVTIDYKKSTECYEKYLEVNSEEYETWFLCAEAYEAREDWGNAIRCYEEAKKIDPILDRGFGFGEGSKEKIKEIKQNINMYLYR